MDLFTGVAANPFIVFTTVATGNRHARVRMDRMKGEITRARQR